MPATIQIFLAVLLLCLAGCQKSASTDNVTMGEEATKFGDILQRELAKYGKVSTSPPGGFGGESFHTTVLELSMATKDFSAEQFPAVLDATIQQWGGIGRFAQHGQGRTAGTFLENGQPYSVAHESIVCGGDGKYLVVDADAEQIADKTRITISIHVID